MKRTFNQWIIEIEEHLKSGEKLTIRHKGWLRNQKMHLTTKGKGLTEEKLKALDHLSILIGHDWKERPRSEAYLARLEKMKNPPNPHDTYDIKSREKQDIDFMRSKGRSFRKKQTKLDDLIHYDLFHLELPVEPDPKLLSSIQLAKSKYGNQWDIKTETYQEYLAEHSDEIRQYVRFWFDQNKSFYKLGAIDLMLGYKKRARLYTFTREGVGISRKKVYLVYTVILHLCYSYNL